MKIGHDDRHKLSLSNLNLNLHARHIFDIHFTSSLKQNKIINQQQPGATLCTPNRQIPEKHTIKLSKLVYITI